LHISIFQLQATGVTQVNPPAIYFVVKLVSYI